jgi:hypothetical protein
MPTCREEVVQMWEDDQQRVLHPTSQRQNTGAVRSALLSFSLVKCTRNSSSHIIPAAQRNSGSNRMAGDMGPAAFMWPPDRTWSSTTDNTPPRGSVGDVGNRTQFPLSTIFAPCDQ